MAFPINMSTTGINTSDDPIRQFMYTYSRFRFMDIPRGMAPLSSMTGTMDSNINFI